ncbi:MAG: hypothetical protein PHS85_05280 [Sulfurovum sp.]|nr:hypothetical protein [Sulfurovum sp.]
MGTKKEVVEGSGVFEVRSDVRSLGLIKGQKITVTNYVVNRKELLDN